MSTIVLKVEGEDDELEEVLDCLAASESDLDWCKYPSAEALLNAAIPPEIHDNSTVVARMEDGELIEIDLEEVLSYVPLAYQHPLEVLSYLLKVQQGIHNMAYVMEEYYARSSDSFRVWRAEHGRKLNRKDDVNPLVAEGSKTTNSAIESYMRSQPEYEEFKNKIAEIESNKNKLWSAKKSIGLAIDAINGLINGAALDEEVEGLVKPRLDEGRARLEDLVNRAVEDEEDEES